MTASDRPTPAGGEPNQKQALLEAFDDVLKADAVRREEDAARRAAQARARRRVSPVLVAALFALAAIGAGVLATRPPWLGFPDPYVEPPAVEDASLRLAIYRARQRVEAYRREHQSLPSSLVQAGVNDPALRMTLVSGSLYVIEGGNDSVRLALRSDEPVRPFLGEAYDVVVSGRSE